MKVLTSLEKLESLYPSSQNSAFTLWNSLEKFLQQLKRELPYDRAILLLGIYQRNIKIIYIAMHTT